MSIVGEMSRFNLLLSLFVALSILMMVSANPRILAAVITCVPFVQCDGTNDDDTMNGTPQNDNMNGLGGKDKMSGNDGPDTMRGGPGVDTINGENGQDFIDELLDTSKNVISGGPDSDYVRGGEGNDTINGGGGQDTLHGYGGKDTIRGQIGDDILQGLHGNDIIYGGDGNDVLAGDYNCDPIYCGADTLKGGPGDDKLFQRGATSDFLTTSDGHKDVLDCGDGNDEAWDNVSIDHDETRNCEVVHKG